MDTKKIVKDQFDKQAEKFSNWSITKNLEYQQRYFEFCGMVPEDTLLDVACGSGEFSIFCAKRIKYVCGVDLSEKMIELAEAQVVATKLNNIHFTCNDVENIPVEDDTFSIVVCKSAFHHFLNYETVFSEMIRGCKRDGRISIQDIVSYDDNRANDFFERLEKEIDKSHNKALSKEHLTDLFRRNKIKILRTYELEIELNFNEYVNHAIQSKANLENISHLVDGGLNDQDISPYFTTINDELFFKRKVFLILGEK
ncbi:MAG: class I SAM-dependent methyltransferase [Methanomicrobia archaeon]|nr:class I SAM-dependent methyltransferase [Methanomicrobia archaeon]